MLDLFNNDAFGVRELTDAVQFLPFVPTRIGSLGLFEERGVRVDKIAVEERDGVLQIIGTSPRGGVGEQLDVKKGRLRSFQIPHIQMDAPINADEVQGVRAFGTESELRQVQATVRDRQADLFRNHDVTLERLRLGALKGQILDADNSVIYNLFTEFGVAQETEVKFDLTAASPVGGELMLKCNALVRTMAKNLGAAVASGVHAFCSAGFWDEFTTNWEVRDSWRRFNESSYLRQGNVFGGFSWGGITWEEYRGSVDGVDFIDAGKAIFFPEGVAGLFRTYFAPADFMETVNTVGLPRYSKIAPDPSGLNRSVLVHTQQNPLPLCLRPKVLMVGDHAK